MGEKGILRRHRLTWAQACDTSAHVINKQELVMPEYQCEMCANVETDVAMDSSGQIDQVRFCFLDRPEFPIAEACEDHVSAFSPIWGD